MNGRKGEGIAGAWIASMVALFGIGITYIIASKAFLPIYNTMYNLTASSTNDSAVLNTFTLLHTSWVYFPLLLVVAVIVYMLIVGLRREPYDYQGE